MGASVGPSKVGLPDKRGFGACESITTCQGRNEMRKYLLAAVAAAALLSAGSAAKADCGDITLAEFSWQSAQAMTNVDQFILNNGYGCNATIVAGDTVPTITAMIEKGQPDISPESTTSPLGGV